MSVSGIFSFLIVWGGIGIFAFSIFVVIAFRTGLVYTARKPDGTLKDRIPIQGILAMSILPIGYFLLTQASNYFGLIKNGVLLNFWNLFLLNYATYTIIFIYDNLGIDWFLLVVLRPKFLELPDEIGKESMSKHILMSIPIGMVIGAILTLINTAISYNSWVNKATLIG